MFSLIYASINAWVNNRKAGDLRRHRTHDDVIVMILGNPRGCRPYVLDMDWFITCMAVLNTLRPRQNGRHFADDIFKRIFLYENIWIPIKISLKFVPRGSINNIPALVQIMAWRRPGDKPLSKPMMGSLLTHICVTRPQWVNDKILPKTLSYELKLNGKYHMENNSPFHISALVHEKNGWNKIKAGLTSWIFKWNLKLSPIFVKL